VQGDANPREKKSDHRADPFVHGRDFPLLKLEFVDGAVEAKVSLSPNDATNDIKFTFGDIGLSNLISYRLQLADGIVSITVNGVTQTVNIFESDPAWADQTFYFKAGSYCQDNDGPATEGSLCRFIN